MVEVLKVLVEVALTPVHIFAEREEEQLRVCSSWAPMEIRRASYGNQTTETVTTGRPRTTQACTALYSLHYSLIYFSAIVETALATQTFMQDVV